MKIKCKVCEGQGFEVLPDRQGEPEQCPCPVCFATGEIDIEISTSDLIAELEKRRPSGCPNKCEYLGSEFCGACIWGAFIGEEKGAITDNFKEAA